MNIEKVDLDATIRMHWELFFAMLQSWNDLQGYLRQYLVTIQDVIENKDVLMRELLQDDAEDLAVWDEIVSNARDKITALQQQVAEHDLNKLLVAECLAVLEATKLYGFGKRRT